VNSGAGSPSLSIPFTPSDRRLPICGSLLRRLLLLDRDSNATNGPALDVEIAQGYDGISELCL
ncbi:MAG: hypothetical protein VX947_06165, partial [Chloroflexota bacterium]|nr:hypothetical protein [Chloroflexota bacterium]